MPQGVTWSYEATLSADGGTLAVEASFVSGFSEDMEVDEGADPFVDSAELVTDRGTQKLQRRGASFLVPCAPPSCRVRYSFRLADAARTLMDGDVALLMSGAVLAPPSTWLLHPRPADGSRYRFHVARAGNMGFSTGVRPAPGMPEGTYEAATGDLPQATYAVFGPLTVVPLAPRGGRIELALAEKAAQLDEAAIGRWVGSSAALVADYYGQFPVDRLSIIVSRAGPGPTRGKTLGDGGASIWLRVGDEVTGAKVGDDWVLVHEMLHVGFPALSRRDAWLAEGLASYLEPFLRARGGVLRPEKLWRDLLNGLPQGLPKAGDRGLVGSEDRDRIYWGGALFCFVADVTIRERTGNARSLDDAVRAALARGGSVERHGSVEDVIAAGDEATGTTVLAELHRTMALAAGAPDLGAMWAKLGVRPAGAQGVAFDETAPQAAVRRAMTERRK
jgi:hypothetical protein